MVSTYPCALSHRKGQNIREILIYLLKKTEKSSCKQLPITTVSIFGQQEQRKNGIVHGTVLRSLHLFSMLHPKRCSLEKVNKAQIDKLPTVPVQVLLLIALPGVEGFY